MDVLVYEPGENPRLESIPGSEDPDAQLTAMQKLVGGYIQVMPTMILGPRAHNYIVVGDEEGKMKEKPYNRMIFGGQDVLVGTFFVCKTKDSEMVGLGPEDIDLVKILVDKYTV